jgi:hypothetical protein
MENRMLEYDLNIYESLNKEKPKKQITKIPIVRYKSIIIFLLIFILIMSIKPHLKKVCLCAVAKEENKYIREFVEHYKRYGIDKIYLYDNNDINGERFEDVINDYINIGFVELIDYHGVKQPQLPSYNDCYKRFNKLYAWLIFFDIDEFIYLKDFNNFKSFLNDERFEGCNRVQLNWIFYTDNNQLYYEDKPVRERFTEREPNAQGKTRGKDQGIKSVIRGNLDNIIIDCPHTLSENTKSCDGFGRRRKKTSIVTKESDFKYYYIEHYACKSTEEFIQNKLIRTDVYHKIDNNMDKINWYFAYNKVTKEKIEMIENRTKYNLTRFRDRIQN